MLGALVSPITRQMGTLQFKQCNHDHTIIYITLLTSCEGIPASASLLPSWHRCYYFADGDTRAHSEEAS